MADSFREWGAVIATVRRAEWEVVGAVPAAQVRVCPDVDDEIAWDTTTVGRTVLIVDDHAGFRRWARVFLEAEGYVVVGEAGDGWAAMRKVATLRPDVVLLDVHLPDVDGFEVARQLDGQRPFVVLISSRDRDEFGDRVRASGVRGFLAKADLSGAAL
jgi:CheY-like chemotaxis protein